MSFEIGSYVDLTYLNQKKAVASRPKKSVGETARELFPIGTQFIFEATPTGFRSAIKINVAFA